MKDNRDTDKKFGVQKHILVFSRHSIWFCRQLGFQNIFTSAKRNPLKI